MESSIVNLQTKDNYNNTKKNRLKQQNLNIKNLWNLFDQEIPKNEKLECIYRNEDNYIYKELCTFCKSHLFIGDEGFYICPNTSCSIIYKDNIDSSPEWRFYGADDNNLSDPTRCGMPINPLLKESSYSCKVLCKSKTTYEMHKIKRYTDWQSMPYKEKSQYDEFQLISSMAQNHGIPKMIINDAIRYHKQISETKTFRGFNRDGIIAASIYISCRINNYPRTSKEIAEIFNLDNTSATKGCKNAITIINELIYNDTDNNDTINLFNKTTPLSFIERYCSKLNINNELTNLCKFVATKIEKNNLIPENTPHSISGGIIYFVSEMCNININKSAITNISKISEVTINKCYKKLYKIRNELIPEVILNKYNNN